MAMRSLLSRNLTGATRCYCDGKGRVSNSRRHNALKKMEQLQKEEAEKEKEDLKKEKAEKEKEDANKKSEGTHLG